jgi:hypothetical protein
MLREGEGELLREGEGELLREGEGEGELLREGEGELLREGATEREPPLEGAGAPLPREPLEGVPLLREPPPEGAGAPREPPLEPPLDPPEPRPPTARCASAGVASMLTHSSRKAQTVRYFRVFMSWPQNCTGQKQIGPNVERSSATRAPHRF